MKTVGIMQPYFLPYSGYISLIKNTDEFILLDTVQFMRHGWIERNRVLKQDQGWLYLQVPLEKHSRDTLIRDVRINNQLRWKEKILAQLAIYRKGAPNYFKVMRLMNEAFSHDFESIVNLNKALLEAICSYLGFPKTLPVFSEMGLSIDPVNAPDEWALNICKALGSVGTYLNPIGGLEFFDRKKYEDHRIKIGFQKMTLEPYDQRRSSFEAGLSIIDVLMYNDIDKVNRMLDNFELV